MENAANDIRSGMREEGPTKALMSVIEESGVPKSEVARRIGISRQALNSRLSDKSGMSVRSVSEILNAVGYRIAYVGRDAELPAGSHIVASGPSLRVPNGHVRDIEVSFQHRIYPLGPADCLELYKTLSDDADGVEELLCAMGYEVTFRSPDGEGVRMERRGECGGVSAVACIKRVGGVSDWALREEARIAQGRRPFEVSWSAASGDIPVVTMTGVLDEVWGERWMYANGFTQSISGGFERVLPDGRLLRGSVSRHVPPTEAATSVEGGAAWKDAGELATVLNDAEACGEKALTTALREAYDSCAGDFRRLADLMIACETRMRDDRYGALYAETYCDGDSYGEKAFRGAEKNLFFALVDRDAERTALYERSLG